jgi:hypothetical protein
MYRIIPCIKDTYITDKIINSSRSIYSNVGQAGTLDLYKLYNETYLPSFNEVYEKTRILIKFDFSTLQNLTSSILNINDPSFKCYLSLKNIYSGLPVPSNFTISINPLAKNFDEGRGFDVIRYQDKDSCNWITSSFSSGVVLWENPGANKSGSIGESNIDYYSYGVINGITSSLEKTFTFSRGDEDLFVDVTTIVSATLAGILPDFGFRIALTQSQESDKYTYFVKRFASRHVRNPFDRPAIIVKYNDFFIDNQLDLYTDTQNTIAIYNSNFGTYENFVSGSQEITGSNCLILELFASRNLTVWSSSFSQTHSKSIDHLTISKIYYSASFTGSQVQINGKYLTGAYYANVFFDSNSNDWFNYVNSTNWDGSGKIENIDFSTVWKSIDGTVIYSSGSNVTVKKNKSKPSNVFERNYIINITNLKEIYHKNETARLRVFIQDYNLDIKYYKIPADLVSTIYKKMYWRLINSNTKQVVIPFGNKDDSTRLSSDGNGMYFDMYMQDLPSEQYYEFEFLINEGGKDFYIQNEGFRFKVID